MCDCIEAAPACYGETIRVARKEHRCCECGKPIKVGKRYEDASGIWEGRRENYRTCLPCATLRDVLLRNSDCDCFVFGELSEHAHDFGLELAA